ncbi:MAG: hypothetical protein AAF911_15180 [Planctomycetota bacterium]
MKRLLMLSVVLAISNVVFAEEWEDDNPEDVGKELRHMILNATSDQLGAEPSEEFPRIYAVITDWRIRNGHIATVGSANNGWASLYTTARFGVIGGEEHDEVRTAAIRCVKIADQFFNLSEPTEEWSYPVEGEIYFYLKTFEGLRVIKVLESEIYNQSHPTTPLFAATQDIVTALRHVSEANDSE